MQTEGEKKVEQNTVEKINFKDLQFGWFVGHALVVLNATIFFLSRLVFYPLGFFYRVSYIATIISYSIVLYNSYKPLATNQSFFKRVLLDENTQYLIVAVYFLLTKRIAITLVPFYIYSVFHAMEYTEKHLIPTFAPTQTKIQESIKNIMNSYHSKAMEYAAKIEVCGVMTRLVLGLFVQCLTELGSKIDQLLTPPTAHPKVPPAVIKAYATVKEKMASKKSL
ncbi:hypothetical protein INT48_007377 [Thamnidium elegans]|uniref:Uncharacterized protein n=1 Tax=Thamnidium elegans TaxID=101142 RepID=A0A8H7SQB6_9FUNG|nr:hypothetical protein INT48_007377 [Thamnidium elegans]